jgi:hypothetical protein
MSQHFKSVNRSYAPIAREVSSLLLWVTRSVLRVLLRRPVIDILLWMLALWFITGCIGRLFAPGPVLQQPAALIESR